MPIGQEVDRRLDLSGERTDIGELVMRRIIGHRHSSHTSQTTQEQSHLPTGHRIVRRERGVVVPLAMPSWVTWLIASCVAWGKPPISV